MHLAAPASGPPAIKIQDSERKPAIVPCIVCCPESNKALRMPAVPAMPACQQSTKPSFLTGTACTKSWHSYRQARTLPRPLYRIYRLLPRRGPAMGQEGLGGRQGNEWRSRYLGRLRRPR